MKLLYLFGLLFHLIQSQSTLTQLQPTPINTANPPVTNNQVQAKSILGSIFGEGTNDRLGRITTITTPFFTPNTNGYGPMFHPPNMNYFNPSFNYGINQAKFNNYHYNNQGYYNDNYNGYIGFYTPNINYLDNLDGTYTLIIYNLNIGNQQKLMITCPQDAFKISKKGDGYFCEVDQKATCKVSFEN